MSVIGMLNKESEKHRRGSKEYYGFAKKSCPSCKFEKLILIYDEGRMQCPKCEKRFKIKFAD